jgi:hypothetical protein
VLVLHAAVAPEQLASLVHCTQVLLVVLHVGLVPEQLPSAVHSTQVFALSLHTGFVLLQAGPHAEVTPPAAFPPALAS